MVHALDLAATVISQNAGILPQIKSWPFPSWLVLIQCYSVLWFCIVWGADTVVKS
jgi:hypothetical protein